jgi:hypothetical protein
VEIAPSAARRKSSQAADGVFEIELVGKVHVSPPWHHRQELRGWKYRTGVKIFNNAPAASAARSGNF